MQPSHTVAFVGNIFTKLIHLTNIGDIEHTHRHTFDHVTLLAHGSVKCGVGVVSTDVVDIEQEFTAPHLIYIPADTPHRFIATSPETVLACLHAMHDDSGDILDPASIPKGINALELTNNMVIKT